MTEIGLWHSCPWWTELLRGEGVPFESRVAETERLPRVLVLDQVPSKAEAATLQRHVEAGNALLAGPVTGAAILPGLRVRSLNLRYVEPDSSIFFRNTGLVWLDSPGYRFVDTAGLRAFGRLNHRYPAVLGGSLARGTVALLPFELSKVLSNLRAVTRQFYAASPRLPYERVSAVDRGGVRRLVVNCLRFLLFSLGLPYVHLSYVPGNNVSVFGFRVDTDESDAIGIDACLQVAEQTGFAFSWFIHTGTLPEETDVLARLFSAGQDIQLHCAIHRVTGRYQSDLANFQQGLMRLRGAGLNPCAAAAPYGIWTPALAQVFADLGLVYSSEFGYCWDSIPLRPVLDGRRHQVLQVPVHPISLGSLLRAKATPSSIITYFKEQAAMQLARMEPCFFYDHPGYIRRHSEVVRNLLQEVTSIIPVRITLTDYARWWLQREQSSFVASTSGDAVTIDVNKPADSVSLVIEQPGRFALAPARADRLSLNALLWIPVRSVPFKPEMLAVLRPSLRTTIQEAVRRSQRRYR